MTSERKRTILCIEVTDIHFDTQACTLRLNGKNVEENPHVKVRVARCQYMAPPARLFTPAHDCTIQLGAYHTIDLELNRKFTLYKTEWDTIALQRVEEATDVAKTADVAALVCQEGVDACT